MRHSYSLAVFLWISASPLAAQIERYVPSPDPMTQQTAGNHLLDRAGNLFVLSCTRQFTLNSQNYIHTTPVDGRSILRTTPGGALSWQRRYSTSQDPALDSSMRSSMPESSALPATPLFEGQGGELIVPYVTLTNGRDNLAIARLATLSVDPRSGAAMRVAVSADSNCCTNYDLQASTLRGGILHSVFSRGNTITDPNKRLYYEQRDLKAGNVIAFLEVDGSWPPGVMRTGIVFDPHSSELLYHDASPRLRIFPPGNTGIRTVQLFDSASEYFELYRLVAGVDHYVMSCRITQKSGSASGEFLLVYDKNWRELARLNAPRAADLVIAEDNTIWTLRNDGAQDAGPQPVGVMQYDMGLKPLRRLRIGRERCSGTKLSIFDGRELVITGNWSPGALGTPEQGPNHTFIYRQNLRDIPGASAALCVHFSVRPNPATNRILIETIPQNPAQALQLAVWNSAGQIVHREEFSTHLELELGRLGGGIYFVQVSDPATQERCISRLVRR